MTVPWLTFDFDVYDPVSTTWNDVSGVYVFAGLDPLNRWVPLYIGMTDSFRNRIPLHERWIEAVQLGASHIHAKAVPRAATRAAIETLLIGAYQPTLNFQLRFPHRYA